MHPRTVLMAAAAGAVVPAEYGNILDRPTFGWLNRSSQYYMGPDSLGEPYPFNPVVHSWVSGQPYWSQGPKRNTSNQFTGYLYPRPDTATPPPLSELVVPV